MASPYWDEALATRYRAFQYSFLRTRPLAGARLSFSREERAGLGAAATMLLRAGKARSSLWGFRFKSLRELRRFVPPWPARLAK